VHGPLLIEVENKSDIRISRVPLSPIRYESMTISVEPNDDEASLRESLTSALLQKGQELLPELEQTAYLVFDLELTGNNPAVNAIDSWTSRATEEYKQELETGTSIIIRKIINNVQPTVKNLQELSKSSTPAGKLAESILALQNGETTDFLNKIIQQWKKRQHSLNKTATFFPLYSEGRIHEANDQLAREYILQECNRLLNTLLNQQEK
jgi:hypothetical protein